MIDMTNILVVMEKARAMMCNLDGTMDSDAEKQKEKSDVRSFKAEISRQLLELADMLALCEVMIRQEYWLFKERGFFIDVSTPENEAL